MATNNYIYQKGFGRIYTIATFLYFINSMHPWFMLWLPQVWASILYFLITLVAINKGYFVFSSRRRTAIIFAIMFIWLKIFGSFWGVMEGILNAFLFLTILSLRRQHLLELLDIITKWLALILLVSIVAYALFSMGISLPYQTINTEQQLGISINNYYFFLYNPFFFRVSRFHSVFLEPGYLTLGVAPLLFLHKYEVKKPYVLILLFSQLLSFSLAGYILLIFGYLYCMLCGGEERKFTRVLVSSLFLFICILMLIRILGQEYFQIAILDRLEWIDGTIVGDDRSSKYLDSVYDAMMRTDNKWFGSEFDVDMSEKGVSGYKLFAVQHGIIGVILVVWAYFSSIGLRRFRFNYQTGFVVFCLLMLYQNSYPTAMCLLVPIACASFKFENNNINTASATTS